MHTLRVTFVGFDLLDLEVANKFGDRRAVITAYNHSTIVFWVPPGASARNNVTVTVMGQTSNVVQFNYNPPVIMELQDASGAPLAFGSCCKYVRDLRLAFGHSSALAILCWFDFMFRVLEHIYVVCVCVCGGGLSGRRGHWCLYCTAPCA